jgi:hypothetical protein
MVWKIGVNSQASRSIGFEPGDAGVSGGCGVGEGVGEPPEAPGPTPAQALRTRATSARRRSGPTIRRSLGSVTS